MTLGVKRADSDLHGVAIVTSKAPHHAKAQLLSRSGCKWQLSRHFLYSSFQREISMTSGLKIAMNQKLQVSRSRICHVIVGRMGRCEVKALECSVYGETARHQWRSCATILLQIVLGKHNYLSEWPDNRIHDDCYGTANTTQQDMVCFSIGFWSYSFLQQF